MRAERLRSIALASAVKSCRENPGVVQHQQVVGPKKAGKFPEISIGDLPGVAVQVKQSRSGTVRERFLCDLLFGKIVVKVRDEHFRWIIGERDFQRAVGRSYEYPLNVTEKRRIRLSEPQKVRYHDRVRPPFCPVHPHGHRAPISGPDCPLRPDAA